jgi:hypothetical protein
MESVKIRKQPHHLKLEVPVPRSRFWINEVPEVCELANESAAGMDLDFIAACNPFFPTEFNIDDESTSYCGGDNANNNLGDAEELYLVPVPAPPPPHSSHDATDNRGLQPRPLRVVTPQPHEQQARLSIIIRDTLREYQDLEDEEDVHHHHNINNNNNNNHHHHHHHNNNNIYERVMEEDDEEEEDDEPCFDLTDASEASSLSSRTTAPLPLPPPPGASKEAGLLRNQIEDLQDEMEQLRAENARMAEQLRESRAANDSLLRRRNTVMLRSASMTDMRAPLPQQQQHRASFPAAPQQIPPGAEQIHEDFTFLYAKLRRHGDLDTDVCWLASRLDMLGVPMNDGARVGLLQTLDEIRDRLRPHVEAVLDRTATA